MENQSQLEKSIRGDLKNVKKASYILATSSYVERQNTFKNIVRLLEERKGDIQRENEIDIKQAEENGLSKAMIDRLRLTDKVLASISQAVKDIASQEEVLGEVIGGSVRPNGMKILKSRVPIGVVAIVYESRPNVTIDAAALAIKSGNAIVLRGGKEAIHSNKILANILQDALEQAGLPRDIVYFIDNTDRAIVPIIATSKGLVDVIIPRGGEGLINAVSNAATIPVIKHDKGVCHTYIDKAANLSMAQEVAFNAKVQRPSTCNAMETLLVHKDIANEFLPKMAELFRKASVELRGSDRVANVIECNKVTDEDWDMEYNDLILSIEIVDTVDEAISHIEKHGSLHSEAIITEDYQVAEYFLNRVDAAAVYLNASTRFTDGGEFGLGAEMGISTQKLHARGPMGAKDLTTYKYIIYGSGQVRN